MSPRFSSSGLPVPWEIALASQLLPWPQPLHLRSSLTLLRVASFLKHTSSLTPRKPQWLPVTWWRSTLHSSTDGASPPSFPSIPRRRWNKSADHPGLGISAQSFRGRPAPPRPAHRSGLHTWAGPERSGGRNLSAERPGSFRGSTQEPEVSGGRLNCGDVLVWLGKWTSLVSSWREVGSLQYRVNFLSALSPRSRSPLGVPAELTARSSFSGLGVRERLLPRLGGGRGARGAGRRALTATCSPLAALLSCGCDGRVTSHWFYKSVPYVGFLLLAEP